jgi:outer membrane protein OmpA-like peptidoglycan-associated protein
MATTTQDDYINCSDYEANLSNKSPIDGAFSIFQKGDDHFFSWNNGNQIVLRSEAYPDEERRDRGINAILKNCDIPERYSVIEEDGKFLLLLYGGGNHMEHTGNRENHSEIGRSCPQESRTALNALLQFKGAEFAQQVVPIDQSSVSSAAVASVAGVAAVANSAVSDASSTVVDGVNATTEKLGSVTEGVKGTATAAVAGAAAAASSLTSKIPGVSSVKEVANDAADYTKGLAGEAAASIGDRTGGAGWLKWLLPLLLLGIVGWFLYNKSCKTGDASTGADAGATSGASTSAVAAIAVPNLTIDSATGVVNYELGDTVDIKLADGTIINSVPKNGFENTLFEFIKSGTIDTVDKRKNWFTLHDVQFKTNSTEYLTTKAIAQIKNVATTLKAYPGLQIKLGGYTDFTGDNKINKPLSDRRAKQVAKDLVANGATAQQIVEAVGYGSDFAECKDKNDKIGLARDRKTAAKVHKKP